MALLLCSCVCQRETESLFYVCVCVCTNVGQCVCVCVRSALRGWLCAQYTASITPLDLVVCVNILCVFHLSLVLSYLSLCVCSAPVNQSSPFTFPLG